MNAVRRRSSTRATALAVLCWVGLSWACLSRSGALAQDGAGGSALWSARPYSVLVIVFHDGAPCWTEAAVQRAMDDIVAASRSLWGEAVQLQVIPAPQRVHDWIDGPISANRVSDVVTQLNGSPYAGMPGLPSPSGPALDYDKFVLLSLSQNSAGWAAYAREYDAGLAVVGPLVRRLGGALSDLQPALAALGAAICPVVEVRRSAAGEFRFRPRGAELDWGGLGHAPLSRPCVLRVPAPPGGNADASATWQEEVFLHYDPQAQTTKVYARRADPLSSLEPNRRFYATVVQPSLLPTDVRLLGPDAADAGWELAVRPLEGGPLESLMGLRAGRFRAPASREPLQWLELRAHGRTLAQWPLLAGGDPTIELDVRRYLPLARAAAQAQSLAPLVTAAALEYELRLAELRATQAGGSAESLAEQTQQVETWRAEREARLLARLEAAAEPRQAADDPVVRAVAERIEALAAEVRESLAAARLAEFVQPPAANPPPVDPNASLPPAAPGDAPAGAAPVPPGGVPVPPGGVPVPPGGVPVPPGGVPVPPASPPGATAPPSP